MCYVETDLTIVVRNYYIIIAGSWAKIQTYENKKKKNKLLQEPLP